jgi:hypothetical protein
LHQEDQVHPLESGVIALVPWREWCYCTMKTIGQSLKEWCYCTRKTMSIPWRVMLLH